MRPPKQKKHPQPHLPRPNDVETNASSISYPVAARVGASWGEVLMQLHDSSPTRREFSRMKILQGLCELGRGWYKVHDSFPTCRVGMGFGYSCTTAAQLEEWQQYSMAARFCQADRKNTDSFARILKFSLFCDIK